MTIYILIWVFFSVLLLSSTKQSSFIRKLVLFLAIIFIGFRYKVGADWIAYNLIYDSVSQLTAWESLFYTDPAYGILNWISYQLGLDIFFVNTVCAFFLTYGLYKLSEDQREPQIGILVAIPNLLIIFGMCYTRQSAAIGFAFLAVYNITQNKYKHFLFYIIIAALFHASSIIILPLLFFYYKFKSKNRILIFPLLVLFSIFIFSSFSSFFASRIDAYTSGEIDSKGGLLRILLNVIPALIFVFFRNRFKKTCPNNYPAMMFLSLGTFFSLLIVPFFSTIADRFGLYFTLIQILVYSNLNIIFTKKSMPIIHFSIFILYSVILTTWLYSSDYAIRYWIPYKNILFN